MTPSLFWRALCNRNTQNSIARILSRSLSTSDRHNFAITKTDPPINSTDIKQEFNDFIEEATGSEKKQLLALLQGDDRYEPKLYHRGPGTKDTPNIVPLHGESRMIGCVCEPDQCYINYMIINMGEVKRCECGYWFKSVGIAAKFPALSVHHIKGFSDRKVGTVSQEEKSASIASAEIYNAACSDHTLA